MAFALTAAYAYPELISAPTATRRGNQVIEIEYTAAATDVDLDIGDLGGTFWTAAGASTQGAGVLAAITALYPQFSVGGCIAIQSDQLLPKVQSAAAGSAGEYAVAINSTTLLPEITFHTAEGPLVGQVRMICRLNNSQLGAAWAYPAAS